MYGWIEWKGVMLLSRVCVMEIRASIPGSGSRLSLADVGFVVVADG